MLEIACFNASSATVAAQAGADRIELCANYSAGGVTPSHSTLQHVRKEVTIPINVMIRPRAGNFNYSDEEFTLMKKDMEVLKPLASGFVFGILDANRRIDQTRNRELVEAAAPLPCTFHRAVDEAEDLEEDKLYQLHSRFGADLSLIAGGGVRSTNIEELKRRTHLTWLHSAAITAPGEDVNCQEVSKMQRELSKVE